MKFRIVIDGVADPLFFESLIKDVMKLTPIGGGFTFQVGTAVRDDDDCCA